MRDDDVRRNGEIGEASVEAALRKKSPICRRNPLKDNVYQDGEFRKSCYWFDIEMSMYHDRWVEVKRDNKTKEFNNVVIETHSDVLSTGVWQPSGILLSKAEYWIIITPELRYWMADLYTLRWLALVCDEQFTYDTSKGIKCTRGVEDKVGVHNESSRVNTKLRAIPIPLLEKYCLDFGTDINKLNTDKIL